MAPDNYREKRGRSVADDLRDFPLPTQSFRKAAALWINETPKQDLGMAFFMVRHEFAIIERFLNSIENSQEKRAGREYDIIELGRFYEDPKIRCSTKVLIISVIVCVVFFAWFAANPASALMGFGIAFGVVGTGSLAWKCILEERPFTTYNRRPKLIMENQATEV